MLGTLDYIAPEQAQSPGKADVRSDLYSLGCTFYYLLTGAAPFADRVGLDKLAAHGRDAFVPVRQRRPDVPETVAAVVGKLLAKKPEDRYPSARALIEALDAATASTPSGSQITVQRYASASGTERAVCGYLRRPHLLGGLLLASAACLLLVVAGIALQRMWNQPTPAPVLKEMTFYVRRGGDSDRIDQGQREKIGFVRTTGR